MRAKRYEITFRTLKNNCENRNDLKIKRCHQTWLHADCTEKNCPILKRLKPVRSKR